MTSFAQIKRAVLVFAVIGTAWAANAADLPRAKPSAVGLNQAAMDKLDADMKALVDDGKRAGVVYGVMRKGKLVALKAYGMRDVARGLPMETDSQFRLYSQSRAVTAAAILTLADEGKLGLDDPVAKYLPEIGKMQVIKTMARGVVTETEPQRTPMTVRELFNYTSGLGYAADWPKSLGMSQRDILALDSNLAETITKLSKYPLMYQPGAKWVYGFHSDVLGRIAEVVSGQPFDEFLRARLTAKIGMTDTDFWTKPGEENRLAEVYTPAKDGSGLMRRDAIPSSTYTKPSHMFSAGGGLISTVEDYLRFCQMLLNGGALDGVEILKPATIAAMGTNALTPAQGGEVNWYRYEQDAFFRGYGWGLAIGVRLPDTVHTMPGSDGDLTWGGLANTTYFLDPAEDITAVAMSQYLGPNADELEFTLREGVYAALGKK
ncbi:MAG: beta-lactamase family protein [Rhodobacteraceae bacterium]|nr:beta-lactamase family protein [Paracoccaceae bacterium]